MGGANFAAALITLGVVDEIRLEINPTILGDGKNLFDTIKQCSELQLIESRTLKSGLVLVRYKT